MTTINRFAGMGGHQSARSKTNSWITPPDLVEALGGWETFDLDPCAEEKQPIRTARRMLTRRENGLLQPWQGRVYLNPPYSIRLLAAFLARMAEHNHGTALIFARTDNDPWHRYIWPVATGLLFIRGRLNFHLPDGSRSEDNAGAPSVLVAYGEDDCDVLAAAPIDGHFVPLRLSTSMLIRLPETLPSWAEALSQFFRDRREPVSLGEIYRAFLDHPKTRSNQFWRDKIRQMLQRGAYERVEKGMWRRVAA